MAAALMGLTDSRVLVVVRTFMFEGGKMDSVIKELKAFALAHDIKIILPKARPLSEREQAEMDAWLANPWRFVDYSGILK
jgi:hypothetical protein